MNFMNRTALGDTLAERVPQFRGKGAVIICLQESSLMTCLTMATQLRAWVYPLVYVPVYTKDMAHELLGAFDQDGEFFPSPDSSAAKPKVKPEVTDAIEDQRAAALRSIKKQIAAYGIELDKRRLDGRDIIIAGDVLTSFLPIVMVQQLLKDTAPKSITAVVGDATPEVAELLHLSAGETEILDVMSGIVFDDNHYFEQVDTYTDEQKHTLTQHIATYWH